MKHLCLALVCGLALAGCGPKKIENVAVKWTPYSEVASSFPAYSKPIFLYVNQSHCEHCEKMQDTIFTRPEVAWFLNENFTSVNVNVDTDLPIVIQGTQYDYAGFWNLLNIEGLPTYYFFDSTGKVNGLLHGAQDVRTFKRLLVYVKNNHFYKTPWLDWLKTEEANLDTLPGIF
ncbi:MAG: DUF255 domain-containing protein [candidate division Zixibacteria bacterium]|nr:DUF255 domain-containing protein [candidate division Zixibacteria bacterium]